MPISLGSITFGIGPDTTRLRQSISDITAFGTAVEAAAQATGAGARQAEAALRKQEQTAISALQKVQRFQDQIARNPAVPQNLFAGLNNLSTTALDQLTARLTQGRLTTIQYQREMERFGQTMSNAQRIYTQWAAAMKQQDANSMVASLQKLSGAAVLVAGPLSGIATRISVIANLADHFSLSWAAAIAGIAAGTFAFYKLGSAAVDTERKLQNIEQTFVAVSGNATIAATNMNYLAGFADKAGAKIDDLSKNFAQIEAAAKGTSLEGERVRNIFEGITLAGAKLGLSTEDVKGSLLAIQQMISKGTIQMEELKGQLGDRLPGALKAYADSLGVTTQKFNAMVKAGDVGASSLVGFVNKLKERYGIDDSTKIDTITAAENRLYNTRLKLIDQLDKIIGFSSAYTNTLNSITGSLKLTDTQVKDLTLTVTSVGIALATAFAASRVVPAIFSIVGAINALTAGIVGLNAATAAGAFRSLVGLLVSATVAVAAYYGSQKLLEDQMNKVKESTLSNLPPLQQYLDAQKNMISTVRGPTLQYLAQETESLDALRAKREELISQLQSAQGKMDLAEKLGASKEDLDKLAQSTGFTTLSKQAVKLNADITTTYDNIQKLDELLDRQAKKENEKREDPAKDLTNRQTLAIKNAKDTVQELNNQYAALGQAPALKEWLNTQNEISKQVENFRDQLSRTELPAAKVTELTNNYAKALRQVKEGELSLKNTTSFFQGLEGVFSRGLDTAMNQWIDTILEGKDALTALRDTGKAVAQDLLRTFIQLAALNPLKNALFGTNYNTLGGNNGIGGLLGNIFGGGSNSLPAGASWSTGLGNPFPTFAGGGVMTSDGPVPLRKYARGGIASTPQMAMFGEGSGVEAYVPLPDGRSIPVTMSGGGAGDPVINIYEAPNTKTSVQRSVGKNGTPQIDVFIKQMAVDGVMESLMKNGPVADGLEKKYGLDRTKGIA